MHRAAAEQDQPRTCGEYISFPLSVGLGWGSAPHMRGIRGGLRGAITCADQPRTCGEYRRPDDIDFEHDGSAPHMRGIPSRYFCGCRPRRISPAHAGNTALALPSGWPHPDQPRTCGEYILSATRPRVACGSAPHMRGIPRPERQAELFRRISPAHAGNTGQGPWHHARGPDQPRTCGEYPAIVLVDVVHAGSAPHMRGILQLRGRRAGSKRISPAHAGNTARLDFSISFAMDQPRTCGEYSWRKAS